MNSGAREHVGTSDTGGFTFLPFARPINVDSTSATIDLPEGLTARISFEGSWAVADAVANHGYISKVDVEIRVDAERCFERALLRNEDGHVALLNLDARGDHYEAADIVISVSPLAFADVACPDEAAACLSDRSEGSMLSACGATAMPAMGCGHGSGFRFETGRECGGPIRIGAFFPIFRTLCHPL